MSVPFVLAAKREHIEQNVTGSDGSQGARGRHGDRVAIFEGLLAQLPRGRLLDLGTGHGAFAQSAKRLGWSVTAVDARTERMPMSPGIEWVEGDVRSFPVEGYDVVTILGLLYHLELKDQVAILSRCSRSLTLIDTHVSLHPTTFVEGYFGHFFEEKLEDARASWGNPTSFWPSEESLFRMIAASGFSSVLSVSPSPVAEDRTFYVAVPKSLEPLKSDLKGFSEQCRPYRLVERFRGLEKFGFGPDAERLQEQRDEARSDLQRLRQRKSVRVALGFAELLHPKGRRKVSDVDRS